MRQRFDIGSVLVGLGALLLLVALFLTWYSPSLSAWDAFEVLDWALAALAVGALVGVARGAEDEAGPARWVPWLAIAALLVVASQLIDPPPAAHGASRRIGAWLAFAASATMAAGGALALANVSVSIDVRGRERRRRLAAVDRRDQAAPSPAAPEPVPEEPPRPADPDRTQPLSVVEPGELPGRGGADET